MPKELTEEEIMENDIDPMDAISAIRREEGMPEEEVKELETELSGESPINDVVDEDDEQEKEDEQELEEAKGKTETSDDEDKGEVDELSPDEQAAADAAAVADAAIAAADKAADKRDGIKVDDDDDEEAAAKTGKSEKVKPGDEKEEKPAGRKFKANGQDFEFSEDEILEQFETVFGQAMNYTQKMQKIAPYRKMISALEQEGVTHDSLNLALDALKGDKGAIKKLLEQNKIDAYDLTSDEENPEPYVPGNYGKNETQLEIDEIIGNIQGDEEFKITTNVIDEQWDDRSRTAVAENPNIITGLHNDIKSGLYDTVAPMAMKMKVLDGNSKSDIEYYMLAGKQLADQMAAQAKTEEGQQKVDDLNADAQGADSKFDKASSEAERKRAASSTGKRADRKGVIDYLDDDDEAYDAWYKKLQDSI